MNHLSWLIYLAEVVGNVDTVTSFMWTFSVLGLIVYLIVVGFTCSMDYGTYGDNGESVKTAQKRLKGLPKVLIPIFCILTVITVLCPSSNTIYAIAASEYGEQALKTPEFSKARQALNVWLDKQLKPA